MFVVDVVSSVIDDDSILSFHAPPFCVVCGCIQVGPIWGFMSSVTSQKWLLFASIASWSATTLLVALSFNFESMLLFRILNGASLSMLVPLSQAIFADLFAQYVLRSSFEEKWLLL